MTMAKLTMAKKIARRKTKRKVMVMEMKTSEKHTVGLSRALYVHCSLTKAYCKT
jgi:hypothetical protein